MGGGILRGTNAWRSSHPAGCTKSARAAGADRTTNSTQAYVAGQRAGSESQRVPPAPYVVRESQGSTVGVSTDSRHIAGPRRYCPTRVYLRYDRQSKGRHPDPQEQRKQHQDDADAGSAWPAQPRAVSSAVESYVRTDHRTVYPAVGGCVDHLHHQLASGRDLRSHEDAPHHQHVMRAPGLAAFPRWYRARGSEAGQAALVRAIARHRRTPSTGGPTHAVPLTSPAPWRFLRVLRVGRSLPGP